MRAWLTGGWMALVRRAMPVAALLFGLAAAPASADPVKASIVIDARTNKVLHASNADTPAYPASLTKMMTLYMAFEAIEQGRISMGTKIKISRHADGQACSCLGLAAGSTIKVEDAIRALITKSANDIATALGEALGGGSEAEFARKMTARAHALGMTSTTFRNANGLPNAKQKTTARDMATLALALQRDFPQHYHLFSIKSFKWGGTTIRNHNRLLSSYDGMDGLKTGYIRASGFNLAASVERNGTRLVAVVLGGKSAASRDQQMAKLLDQAFAKPGGEPLVALTPPVKPTDAQELDRLVAELNADAVIDQGDAELPEGPVPPRRPAELQVAQAATAAAGDWSIQVGAFKNRAAGEKAAWTALSKLPDLSGVATPTVAASKTKSGTLYRALLTGLDEAAARAGCAALKRAKADCLPLAPRS